MKIDHEYYAKIILKYLIDYVLNYQSGERYIVYSDLAEKINYPALNWGRGFPNSLKLTLTTMGYMYSNFNILGWEDEIPPIQCLLVRSDTNLPGEGLREFYPEYPLLDETAKRKFFSPDVS